jgi:predicted nucleic acid-binding protein
MKYLLDVNVLLAWGWADHADHHRAVRWIVSVKKERGTKLLTSPIPELGFVRVSMQRAAGRLDISAAAHTLASMLKSLGRHHAFLPDDCSAAGEFPAWCGAASRTTDGHLVLLARAHGADLATLDTGIPGAFLVPP